MAWRCLFALVVGGVAWCEIPPGYCGAAPAAHAPVTDAMDFDANTSAFRALRDRYPDDLLVHERYQDAVVAHGIEGHLRSLTEDYQARWIAHPSDLMYRYLHARALIGRSTNVAVQALEEIVRDAPEFAPSYRELAAIYASEAFHDASRERKARAQYFALCPGRTIAGYPVSLPVPSPLMDEAERLLEQEGDPRRAVELATRALRDDEWRLQRIRPFDWYSSDFKRQVQRELRGKYWRAWSVQVRCFRREGLAEKAAALLHTMDRHALALPQDESAVVGEILRRLHNQ